MYILLFLVYCTNINYRHCITFRYIFIFLYRGFMLVKLKVMHSKVFWYYCTKVHKCKPLLRGLYFYTDLAPFQQILVSLKRIIFLDSHALQKIPHSFNNDRSLFFKCHADIERCTTDAFCNNKIYC